MSPVFRDDRQSGWLFDRVHLQRTREESFDFSMCGWGRGGSWRCQGFSCFRHCVGRSSGLAHGGAVLGAGLRAAIRAGLVSVVLGRDQLFVKPLLFVAIGAAMDSQGIGSSRTLLVCVSTAPSSLYWPASWVGCAADGWDRCDSNRDGHWFGTACFVVRR